jgi:hypothetical protein
VFGRVLPRIGHVQGAAEVLDVERGEARRKGRIGEASRGIGLARRALQNVDRAAAKVGGIQIAVAGQRRERGALVDVGGRAQLQRLGGRAERAAPAGDRAALADEEEVVAVEGAAAGRAVEDLAGDAADGNGDGQGDLVSPD